MRSFALLLLTAAVAQASVTVSRTSDNGLHPSAMEIEVMLPDSTKILIPLTRTDAFEDIPMTLVENGVSRTFSSHQVHHPSHSHYRDIQSRAVISVRHVNGKRQISGHVMHEGTSYFLEPFGDSEHRVTKNEMNPEAMAKQIDATKLQRHRKRQTKTTATTNTVELYLLIDSTVWSAFVKIFGSEAAALPELHIYYTNILNGIDTTYRNIQTVSISVSCVGILISKTAGDDAWMTGSTEASPILAKMAQYIVGQTPSADHYMGFTRLDLTDSGSPSVCGMAYVSSTCTANRVSINEDQGLHSWGTAAHELGHNLGSQHDSTGNTCSTSSKNIMAPSTNFYSIADVANSYRFSSCSEKYISDYVTKLGATSCMQSVQFSSGRVPNLSGSDREGARLTLDQVCRLSYPDSPGKFFLSSDVVATPAKICTGIFCTMTSGGGSATGGLRAPVGTPCGNQKSCTWNGDCTADSTAPAADETCFWGDSWSASNCLSWKNAIIGNYGSCSSSLKKSCCKTLGSLCAGY